MDPTRTEQPEPPSDAASPMPLAFTCAVWVPTFAVVLWFMLRLFGPRPLAVVDDEDPPR